VVILLIDIVNLTGGSVRKFKSERLACKVEVKRICNYCGAEVTGEAMLGDKIENFVIQWGYFSKKDGSVWSFDLCEDCIDKIAESFKIPPTVIGAYRNTK